MRVAIAPTERPYTCLAVRADQDRDAAAGARTFPPLCPCTVMLRALRQALPARTSTPLRHLMARAALSPC